MTEPDRNPFALILPGRIEPRGATPTHTDPAGRAESDREPIPGDVAAALARGRLERWKRAHP